MSDEKTEGTELTPSQGGDLVDTSMLDDYSGLETITGEDIIMPRFKIVQPTASIGKPGNYISNLAGPDDEGEPALSVVILKIAKSRVLWGDDLEAKEPLCRSFDGLLPDPSIETPGCRWAEVEYDRGKLTIPTDKLCNPETLPKDPECGHMIHLPRGPSQLRMTCPQSHWYKGNRPPCDSVYTFLLLDSSGEIPLPFWLALSGASIRSCKRLITALQFNVPAKIMTTTEGKKVFAKRKVWECQITFSTVARDKPKPHFVMEFSKPEPIEDNSLQQLAVDMITQFRDTEWSGQMETERETADGAAPDDDMPEFMSDGDKGKKK
jgi:hypothetical protein